MLRRDLYLNNVATDLIEVDVENPSEEVIERAVRAIARGEVVGVPTDALYVMMADPLNLLAVGRVFQAKGRESVRSLPLLVNDVLMAEDLAKELSSRSLYPCAAFLARPTHDDCAGASRSSTEGHRKYRPPWFAPVHLQAR